jgi:hypothetical protein
MCSLAPSDEVWAHEDMREFEASYVRQLEGLGAEAILERLARIGDGRPVVLLCWEKPDDEWCHRWQLADFLQREVGVSVPELEPGMLGKRPDAPQQALFD